MVDIAGHRYSCTIASDINRDGMSLELWDADERALLLEVFYSDQDASITLTAFRESIPVDAVEWAIREARTRLRPVSE